MTDAATRPRLRRSTLDDLSGGRPIIVLAPHPDDESLGCGALLAAAFAGPGAHVVCVTDGAGSHPGSTLWPPARLAACRAAELEQAVAALGGTPRDITRLDLPDTGTLDLAQDYPRIAGRIAGLIRRLGAGALFATAETDPHCDHVATARIAALAAKRARVRLLSYPVWSRWAAPDFRDHLPHEVEHRFDAGPARAAKARAIAAHRSQMGPLVPDDPEGFVMTPETQAHFRSHPELFLLGPDHGLSHG